MNEQGNSLILGLMILLLFSSLSLHLIKKRVERIQILKDKQELFICTKEINGLTARFIADIKKTNKYLQMATLSNILSITFPQVGIITKVSTKSAIKTLKALQQIKTNLYLKNLIKLRMNSCSFSLVTFKTPIVFKLWKIQRDKLNRALFRSKKWRYTTIGNYFQIRNTLGVEGSSKSTLINRGKHWWKQLLFAQY